MWNPFRRRRAEAPFPRPKWPPIQKLDSLDIIGKRLDGGLDLIIVASQPLDDSSQTLESIRHKVGTYLKAIGLEGFQAEWGPVLPQDTKIIISCACAIHPAATTVIEECQKLATAQGVQLAVQKTPAEVIEKAKQRITELGASGHSDEPRQTKAS